MTESCVLASVAQNAPLPVSPVVLSVASLRSFSSINPEDTCFIVKPDTHPAIKKRFSLSFGIWRRVTLLELREILDSLGSLPVYEIIAGRAVKSSHKKLISGLVLTRRVVGVSGFSLYFKNANRNSVTVRLNITSVVAGDISIPSTGVSLSLPALSSVQRELTLIDDTNETLLAVKTQYRNSVSVTKSPNYPGMALLRVSDSQPVLASPQSALEHLELLERSHSVFCDDLIADLAAAQSAEPLHDDYLYPHQQDALGKLSTSLTKQVLALDPGSGKTAVCCRLASRASLTAGSRIAGPVVICAPTTLVSHWVTSLSRFASDLNVLTPKTNKEAAAVFKSATHKDVVVLSQPLLRQASFCESILLLVIDEAHKMVSGDSSYKLIKTIGENALKSVLVTGTPEVSTRINKRLTTLLTGKSHTIEERQWLDSMGPYVTRGTATALPAVKFSVISLKPTDADNASTEASAIKISSARASLESSPSSSSQILYQRAVLQERLSKASPSIISGLDAPLGAKELYILRESAKHQVIVCVGSVASAKSIASRLSLRDRNVLDLSLVPAAERSSLLSPLDPSVQIIVIPDEMMLGLNIPSVERVLHADVPASKSVALQRSARSQRLDSKLDKVQSVFLVLNGTSEEQAVSLVFPKARS